MAASFERTETPTQRRRQRAHEQGTVARSPMAMAVGSVGGCALLCAVAGGALWGWLVSGVLATPPQGESLAWATSLVRWVVLRSALVAAILAGGAAAGATAVGIAQTGFMVAPALLRPDLNRLNPIAGLARLATWHTAAEAGRVTLMAGLGAWLLGGAVRDLMGRIGAGAAASPQGVFVVGVGSTSALLGHLLAVGAVVAAADYGWKRWQLERQLRMTRQELREELRETEGDPFWRARRRARARAMARARMMQAVPRATVVVTNPTEIAVALRYGSDLPAPRVVAKGRWHVADRIRAVAARAGVPIYPHPPLAQALYAAADVGEFIPPRLYRAVAEVLAWVYSVAARQEETRVSPRA
jgi:flagellar biosynthetic protein FlhB